MSKLKVRIELKEAKEAYEDFNNDIVKIIGDSFLKNFDNISSTSCLPWTLLAESQISYYYNKFLTIEVIKDSGSTEGLTEEQKNELQSKRNASIYKRIQDEITYERIVDEAHDRLEYLTKSHKEVEGGLDVLKLNTLANSWTAFETLSKDLWVSVVNKYPKQFSRNSIQAIKNKDEVDISGKSISIGLLSKYDFNLSACMGTILSDKLDFTSASGIAKAYKLIFNESEDIEHFNFDALTELEIIRHVIVHNAGFVDRSFLNRSKNLNYKLGERINLSYDECSALCNAALKTGITILSSIDNIINELTKINTLPGAQNGL